MRQVLNHFDIMAHDRHQLSLSLVLKHFKYLKDKTKSSVNSFPSLKYEWKVFDSDEHKKHGLFIKHSASFQSSNMFHIWAEITLCTYVKKKNEKYQSSRFFKCRYRATKLV